MNKMYLGFLAAAMAFSACSSNDKDEPKPAEAEERWRISGLKDYGEPGTGQTSSDTTWLTFVYNADGTLQEVKERYKNTNGLVKTGANRMTYLNGKLSRIEESAESGSWTLFREYIYRNDRLALALTNEGGSETSTDSIVYGNNAKPSGVFGYRTGSTQKTWNKLTWSGETLVSDHQAVYREGQDTSSSVTSYFTFDNKPNVYGLLPDQFFWKMDPPATWQLSANNLIKSVTLSNGIPTREETHVYTADDKGRIVKHVQTRKYTGGDPNGYKYTIEFQYEKY